MEESLYNLNIERAVLSSILFDAGQYEAISEKLAVGDFYLPAHQNIYKAMGILHKKEQPIDMEFVKHELVRNNHFDENALLEILAANPISNTTAYVKEIKDMGMKRNLITLATQIKQVTIEQNLDANEVADMVEKKLFEITQDNMQLDFKDGEEVAVDTLDFIKRMKDRGVNQLVGVDTGFADLNKMTTGFGEGDLIIVAARPAMGKTAFALNIMLNLLRKGKGVAFFSLEMPAEQLMLRVLAADTSIPLQNLRTGNVGEMEWPKLNNALNFFEKSALFVDDQGSLNIAQLRSKLRKLKVKHPEVELAIVDYLQIMASTGTRDRHAEVSEISRGLKMLARELKMPIIALSQLNRSLESRNDKRPMLSDIRESGAIEQDADIIMFVYREDVYLYKEEKEREKAAKKEGKDKEFKSTYVEKDVEEAEIIIGKQRNGPTGHIKLKFHKSITRFADEHALTVEHVYKPEAQMQGIPNESISMSVL
ncbi:MAG: DNA helicase [Sulfuricurvum sp. PC08-66]|nr:MAG: DNA helicase [Sulfuricurvum sp. PC08-66]